VIDLDNAGFDGASMAMTSSDYVHGYSDRERARLQDQSQTLSQLLHHNTVYPAGARVLEAGCGVGAQTVILARNSPGAHFTSIDVSVDSLAAAQAAVSKTGASNVTFQVANLYDLTFPADTFDHVFVCFVLEHLNRPDEALRQLKRVVKPDGTITVIEGDHGSTFFHPHSDVAWRTIQCLVDLQARAGGNSLIGRQLFPLLNHAGFRQVTVSPRFVYADSSRRAWVDGFTEKTYIAMVEGVRERALAAGLIDAPTWDRGIAELRAAAGPDGTFCYTFFKATAFK
jgi:ubiquinone/menaquinone biosynthesis C-methylase UbiE